jgi:hypothetical protein
MLAGFVNPQRRGDRMADPMDLETEMMHIWNSVRERQVVISGASDTALVKGTAVLGLAVIRLDKTSSRLSKVNIALTVVILLVGIAQIALMICQH